MYDSLYNTVPYIINAAIQATAFVFMLRPRWSRWWTALCYWGVLTLMFWLLSPYAAALWATALVLSAAGLMILVLFRGGLQHRFSVAGLIALTDLTVSTIPLPGDLCRSQTFAETLAYALSPEAVPFRLLQDLIFLVAVIVLILWIGPALNASLSTLKPAVAFYISIQSLMQVVLMILMIRLADIVVDLPVMVALWLINCCSLCLIGAFLSIQLRKTRELSEFEDTIAAAQLQKQYLPSEMACTERAEQIRTDVLHQLSVLAEQIRDGEDGLPPPSLKDRPQYSASLAVNALIEYKAGQAAAAGIVFVCRSQLNMPSLSEFAVCTIAANLLDNAMSSVSQENPWIKLDCIQRGGIRSLICTNSVCPDRSTGSRKDRKGLGLSIIRATTQKAGGRMYIESTYHAFSVILSFTEGGTDTGTGGTPPVPECDA